MAENPGKRSEPKMPPELLLPIRDIVDVDEFEIDRLKIEEIAQLIKVPSSLSEEERKTRIARALDLYESLKPEDGLEGMLAIQMVGTHHAILECLRRAAIPGQTIEGVDMNLKHAAKLQTLYTNQVAALDKHRGKGQQKVTVEHVNVASGGQAIVGNVKTGAPKKRSQSCSPDPGAVEQQEAIPVDFGSSRAKTERGKSKRG